jgi:hypothetical protein
MLWAKSCCRETGEQRIHGLMRRLRGVSDDMAGQIRNGTWETLADPDEPNMPLGEVWRRAFL